MQLRPRFIAVAYDFQRGGQARNFMGQQRGAEDTGKAVAHQVVAQLGRRGEKAGAARKRLGQAGGDEVHPVGQAQLGAQPRAGRAMRAQ
jgi:hypothetical protein